jgi:hypothetical protein
MSVLLVTYDLKKPGRNYQPVYDYLKKFNYCHTMDSVWLIDTALGVVAVRDALMKLIDENDVVFVVRLQNDWAAWRYGCANWLKDPLRKW